MRTVSVRVEDLKKIVIPIGFVGENLHTKVIIDSTKVFADYPDAIATMTVQPAAGAAYPAVVVRNGNAVEWDVSDSDLVNVGRGEIQLSFTVDEVIAKSYIGMVRVERSILPAGEVPEPIDDWMNRAETALSEIDGLTASAETLAAGSSATAEIAIVEGHKNIALGIPKGDKGDKGDKGNTGAKGEDGADGFSPTVGVSSITGGHRLTITDANGTQTVDVMDGDKGDTGNGIASVALNDDYTLTINYTNGQSYTTTSIRGAKGDKGNTGATGATPAFSIGTVTTGAAGSSAAATITGTAAAPVLNLTIPRGNPGDATIDDTAGAGDTTKVWSADKSSQLKSAIENQRFDLSIDVITGSIINTGTGAVTTLFGFSYADVPVTAGDVLYLTGWASSDTYSPAFWDSTALVKATGIVDTDTGNYNAVKVTVPDGATRLLINGRPSYNQNIKVEKSTGLSYKETDILNFSDYESTDITVTTGKRINTITGALSDATGFSYAIVNVVAGDLLVLSGFGSTEETQPTFWNASALVWTTGFINTDTGEFTRKLVIVPDGATRLFINGRQSAGYNIKIEKVVADNDKSTVYWNEYIKAALANKYDKFEMENADRRIAITENRNGFAWAAFDKPYFVFVHDDTNSFIGTAYAAFHAKSAPLSEAAIVDNITSEKLAILKNIVSDGGEILAHYNSSPTQSSPDSEWIRCTRDVKYALENMGFEINGIVIANSTNVRTAKGEKYYRRYFDYGIGGIGQSEQFLIPRPLLSNYADLDAFKAKIDEDSLVNGIHAFGFHGGRQDEVWVTEENLKSAIDYIRTKTNCEITTFKAVYDAFASSVLEERIKAIEAVGN